MTNRPEGPRSTGIGVFDVAGRMLRGGYVDELEQVTPTSLRMRLAGPKLAGLAWSPGDHVRVRVAGALTLRTYSVWDADPDAGWIDLVLFDHGDPDGIGVAWAEATRVGDYVVLARDPRGIRLNAEATWHLFVGEETAAVAFGSLLRALPEDVPVFGVHQAGTEHDHIELPRALTRIARQGAPAASSQQLVDAVKALDLPEDPGAACLAGEARTIQMIRTHLVSDRGWHRRAITTKPFWTPGKRGMD